MKLCLLLENQSKELSLPHGRMPRKGSKILTKLKVATNKHFFRKYFTIIAQIIDLTGVTAKKQQTREQRYWIKSLALYVSDRQHLLSGEWLSDAVINCAQDLLKTSYPDTGGLQKTTLAFTLSYAVEKGEYVQIMRTQEIIIGLYCIKYWLSS